MYSDMIHITPPALPPLDPAPRVGDAPDVLGVLPEVAVLWSLALGLPSARLDGWLHAVHARGSELDVAALDVVALHHRCRVLVPYGSEDVEAEGGEAELVAEGLEGEAVALGVELLELGHVNTLTGLLLEEVDAQTVVGGALLGESGQPGHGELVLGLYPAQGQRSVCRAERNVGSQVMAALGEGIPLRVGNIRVNDDDGDQTLSLVKDLHAQPGGVLADEAVDDLARGDLELAEVELDVGGWLELGEDVGDDVELLDSLGDEAVVVGAPLLFGVVAVDGLVHVAWGC